MTSCRVAVKKVSCFTLDAKVSRTTGWSSNKVFQPEIEEGLKSYRSIMMIAIYICFLSRIVKTAAFNDPSQASMSQITVWNAQGRSTHLFLNSGCRYSSFTTLLYKSIREYCLIQTGFNLVSGFKAVTNVGHSAANKHTIYCNILEIPKTTSR